MNQAATQNGLLRRVSASDFEAIAPYLQPVWLNSGEELIQPNQPIEHIYFIESGIVSVVTPTQGPSLVEVGLVGREGVTEQVLAEGDFSAFRWIVQGKGSALAIGAEKFSQWASERPPVQSILARFSKYAHLQTACTVLSNSKFTVDERLARWLLMCFDRTNGDDLTLFHNTMASMLGVRRSGVTTALHMLEGEGAIKATRGIVRLQNRAKLERLAAGAYGLPEQEYLRLLGPPQT